MKNDIRLYEKMPVEVNHFPIRLLHMNESFLAPHWHEHIELIYMLNGECDFTCGKNTYPVKAHDLIVVNGNDIHFFENAENNPAEYYCIIISPEFFSDVVFKNVIFASHIKNDDCISDCFHAIYSEYREKKEGYDIALKGYASILFAHLIRNYKIASFNDSTYGSYMDNLERINKVISYIEENYPEKITAQILSEMTYLSEGYFYHYFKNTVGTSLNDYINKVRIKKAANMLKSTDASVTEIAASVGYGDINYFSRIFKKIMKVSPSGFRSR